MEFYYGVSSMQVESTEHNCRCTIVGVKALIYLGLAPSGESKEKTKIKL